MAEQLQTTITDFLGIPSLEFYPQEGKNYYYCFVGLDPALGISSDFTAIQGIDAKDCTQVFEWRSNSLPPKEALETILAPLLNCGFIRIIEVVIESNAIGHEFISRYQELPEKREELHLPATLPPLYYEIRKGKMKYGIESTGVNKPLMIGELRDLLRINPEMVKSHRLLLELFSYQILKGGKLGTPRGKAQSDDLVMAFALAVRGRGNWLLSRPDNEILQAINLEIEQKALFPDYAMPSKIGSKVSDDIILEQPEIKLALKKWMDFYEKLGRGPKDDIY